MQEQPFKMSFTITNPTVKEKIYRIWQSRIPMQPLFEELIKQADIEYYQNQLVDEFPV
jgi:hypothetical protein